MPLLTVDTAHPAARRLSPASLVWASICPAPPTRAQRHALPALPRIGRRSRWCALAPTRPITTIGAPIRYTTRIAPTGAQVASHGSSRRRTTGRAQRAARARPRARSLDATAVVVLNGEIDDPQGAAPALVALDRAALRARLRAAHLLGDRQRAGDVAVLRRAAGRSAAVRRPRLCPPDQYAALVTATPPRSGGGAWHGATPLIVADEWITNATDQSWTGLVTAVDTHTTPSTRRSAHGAVADGGRRGAERRRTPGRRNGRYRSTDGSAACAPTWSSTTDGRDMGVFRGRMEHRRQRTGHQPALRVPAQAVFVARLLLHLAHGDGVRLAAWAPPLYGVPAGAVCAGQPRPATACSRRCVASAAPRLCR